MEITWHRTRVGLIEQSQDFTARNRTGIDVGRVYLIDGGPDDQRWYWTFILGHSQFRMSRVSGVQRSRANAYEQVAKAYQLYLETPGSEGGGLSRIPVRKTANSDGTPRR
ncbi:hypothetical protein [Phyllobacterium lublinensis]|uniref:hypothetical protein n=1 Tax=Phyllobacterium lublinensis TaxID=2875708 RepID=UPI001CCB441E|nr:hypothetical protein [Phyllobacterium sp. 2063]MBZ9654662.1 hypothetical protein [Phyllobacterium sp. 2063]